MVGWVLLGKVESSSVEKGGEFRFLVYMSSVQVTLIAWEKVCVQICGPGEYTCGDGFVDPLWCGMVKARG
jgi:hypothetical protein